jgi:hypothetical protein
MQIFFWITHYIGDTHNARTLILMNTHTQTRPTPRSIFEECAGKSSKLTKSPHVPRCRQERHLALKVQTPLNPEKFTPTGSRTQECRKFVLICLHSLLKKKTIMKNPQLVVELTCSCPSAYPIQIKIHRTVRNLHFASCE